MQRFFSVIIIFAILVVGGGWVLMKKSEEQARTKTAEALASARRTFADKARAAAKDDDASYLRSIKAALAAYKEELDRRVYTKNKELYDPLSYQKEVEARFEKGEIKEAQRKSMLEGYQLVKDAHDVLMAGNWSPVLTAAGEGGTRLDIYELVRTNDDDGRPVLEGKFFFWGVEDSTRMRWGQMALRFWKTEKALVKEGREPVEREVGKVLGKADGEAQPRILIQTPGRYIEQFPSYVSIGRIWLPAFPHEATAVDLEYSYVAQWAGGGESASTLKWEKVPARQGWKLREGEQWEADVVEATEDEIAGKPHGDESTP